MRKVICFVLIFNSYYSASAQGNFGFKKLNRRDNVFILPDHGELFILSDSVQRKSSIEINGKAQKTRLKFFIQPDETTEVYYSLTKYGKVLIIESYVPNSTGLSASIINLTFLLLKNEKVIGVEFSNSFFEGIESVKIENGRISIKVFRFIRYTNTHTPLCCVSDFLMNDLFKFEKYGNSYCIDFDSKETIDRNQECLCSTYTTQYVLD